MGFTLVLVGNSYSGGLFSIIQAIQAESEFPDRQTQQHHGRQHHNNHYNNNGVINEIPNNDWQNIKHAVRKSSHTAGPTVRKKRHLRREERPQRTAATWMQTQNIDHHVNDNNIETRRPKVISLTNLEF